MAGQSARTLTSMSFLLRGRWLALFSKNPEVASDAATNKILHWWDYIESHYSEKTRHYHTLEHVNSLLGLLDAHTARVSSPRAVTLAIFFHDVIYDPKAGDNEEKSAEAFLQFSEEHLQEEQELVKNVYDWILLTKKHVTPEHDGSYGTEDRHYFLDFDMQVLGWPAEEYQVYSRQIRQEYIHIPEEGYTTGRSQVLRKFLERPRIFATEYFHTEFEAQARRNIMDEIQDLEAGSI